MGDNSRVIASIAKENRSPFGELRVATQQGWRFDVEFIYDRQPLLFDSIETAGAIIAHNANSRDLTLAINGVGATAVANQIQRWGNPYTPGSGQRINLTGTLDEAGLGGTAYLFLKNGIDGSEIAAPQSEWSITAVDDVDWSKSHIIDIDFQSLKVGLIRFAMNRSGNPMLLHEIANDNLRTGGYWQSPALPIYWKIYNTATNTISEFGYGDDTNGIGIRYVMPLNATAKARAICGTVKSETGLPLFDIPGFPFAVDTGVTGKTVSTTIVPILSIRPKQTFKGITYRGLTLPQLFSLQTNNPIRLMIVENAILTGAVWQTVDTESAVEYDLSATAVSGGVNVFSDYIGTGSKNQQQSAGGFLGKNVLSHRYTGQQDTLTIVAVRTSSLNADVLAGIGWKEIR